MQKSDRLGTQPIAQLIREQAIPASIGILLLSINGIVDTIFVGKWIGSLAIGAITVVLPIQFLIASIGMAIGVGGASIISRALGANDREKAFWAFGNQATLNLVLAISIVGLGYQFQEEILTLFGGKGKILPLASEYFSIILCSIPFLAWAMMSNNIIRALGAPKFAMMIMLIPAIINILLDPIMIVVLDLGIRGAAWATAISFISSAAFACWFFFISGKSELQLKANKMRLKWPIVNEIFSIGAVTLARQGTVSLLSVVLNNMLFAFGGELSISVYGIISRLMMFANFPVLGLTQGFLPVAGYNYGAQHFNRVEEVIKKSILYGTIIALFIFTGILTFAGPIVSIFTNDPELIRLTRPALITVFLATPLITIQLIGSAYYQAIGKALPALFLTMTKQGFFLIPLLFILPPFFGIDGIWYAFPIADVSAALITFIWLRKGVKELHSKTVDRPLETV